MTINDLAKLIKEENKALRAAQKLLSKFRLDTTFHTRYEEADKVYPFCEEIRKHMNKLISIRRDFRTQHIVNSMLRGKCISQIEPKTAQDEYSKKIKNIVYDNTKLMLKDLGKEWME